MHVHLPLRPHPLLPRRHLQHVPASQARQIETLPVMQSVHPEARPPLHLDQQLRRPQQLHPLPPAATEHQHPPPLRRHTRLHAARRDPAIALRALPPDARLHHVKTMVDREILEGVLQPAAIGDIVGVADRRRDAADVLQFPA